MSKSTFSCGKINLIYCQLKMYFKGENQSLKQHSFNPYLPPLYGSQSLQEISTCASTGSTPGCSVNICSAMPSLWAAGETPSLHFFLALVLTVLFFTFFLTPHCLFCILLLLKGIFLEKPVWSQSELTGCSTGQP